ALCRLWSERGNSAATIKDKRVILRGLLRPFLPIEHAKRLFDPLSIRASVHRSPRLPFTDAQISRVLTAVHDRGVRPDDRMLVLLCMSGARIEELYQLRSEDVVNAPSGWILRIADHRQTGSGQARLKNS